MIMLHYNCEKLRTKWCCATNKVLNCISIVQDCGVGSVIGTLFSSKEQSIFIFW